MVYIQMVINGAGLNIMFTHPVPMREVLILTLTPGKSSLTATQFHLVMMKPIYLYVHNWSLIWKSWCR